MEAASGQHSPEPDASMVPPPLPRLRRGRGAGLTRIFGLLGLALIGLVGNLILALALVNWLGGGTAARSEGTRATLSIIAQGVARYQLEFSEPPDSLAALVSSRHVTPTAFVDSGSRPLHYRVYPGVGWRVWSDGPDGVNGTADDIGKPW